MALDISIDAATFDGLNDAIKTEYVKDGDGYKLDVRGIEDTGALKRAKDREVTDHSKTKASLKEATEKLADVTQQMTDLTESHKTAISTATKDLQERADRLTGHLRKQCVDDVAFRMATEISTAPDLMVPHIVSRLQADVDGEKPTTKILGTDGKVNEKATLDDLKKELAADKRFHAIIKGSGASGGGAGGGARHIPGGGAANNSNNGQGVNLGAMSPKEYAAYRKANNASQT